MPFRVALHNSKFLASHTVHVTSDAKTRPTITTFTTMSALRNMPQGDKSRGSAAFATTGMPTDVDTRDGSAEVDEASGVGAETAGGPDD